ncbi:MAG: hypothetical protein ACLSX5_05840 [Lachnospiraceae bacterium]
MKTKRALAVLAAAMMLVFAMSCQAFAAFMDVGSNQYLVAKKIPEGKVGKSLSIPITINAGEEDMQGVWVGLSADIFEFNQIMSDESNGDYTVSNYPFEITQDTFKPKRLGSISPGKSKSTSISVKLRKDLKPGYYSIPIAIYVDCEEEPDTDRYWVKEYLNIYVSESAGTSESEEESNTVTFVLGEGQSTPYGTYPNVMNFAVNMRNSSKFKAYDVTVSMVLDADSTKFPFNINDGNYDRHYDLIEEGQTVEVPYSMAIREDSYSGFYPIQFKISYRDSQEGDLQTQEATMYVQIVSKSKEDPQGDFNANDRTRARIIVDSYETVPEEIYAGQEFELILHMKNASSNVPASNILFTLESEKVSESAVFTTEDGANSVVVNSLGAGETAEVRMKFSSKGGADPRSYSITIKEKYDSPEFKNAEETVTVDIPVKQEARLSTSTIDIMPESISVGAETNVMFGINNTGKVQLYNVTVRFEGDSIKTEETYVGNIKPGETGNVDTMLTGVAATMDEGIIPIVISYEDENGNVSTEMKEMTLFVSEPMPEDMDWDVEAGNMDDIEAEGQNSLKNKFMGLPIAARLAMTGGAAAAVIGAIVGIRVLLRRRKNKKQQLEEEEGIDDEIS